MPRELDLMTIDQLNARADTLSGEIDWNLDENRTMQEEIDRIETELRKRREDPSREERRAMLNPD